MLTTDQKTLRLDVDVRLEAQFDFMSDEYRAFFRPDRATAFQAPLWMDMIHRQLAPGLKAIQNTITIRSRVGGELVAVIPLVLQRSMGVSILQPADFGVCDYNCVVADQGSMALIAADSSLMTRIASLMRQGDLVLFRKVREDRFDIVGQLPGVRESLNENPAHCSEIGDNFDEWKARTIRKKFSKELERLQRKLAGEFGGYEHRAAQSETEIRQAFDFLKRVRRGRFENDLLANPLYFDFYRDYAIAAGAYGEAITYVSYVGNEPAAVLFGLNGDGEFHAVLIGSDMERFSHSSPGTQIIYQVIKKRFAEGSRRFDMGLGNSSYKSRFRVDEVQLRNYTMARSVMGSTVATVYHRAKPIKNLLKKLVPHVR